MAFLQTLPILTSFPCLPPPISEFKSRFFSQDFESSAEIDDVPTLHVLFARPTPPTIIPRTFPATFTPSQLKTTRDALLTWIADESLGGDTHAAEWVLLSAIARTHSRTPPVYPPSLTLSSFPAPSDATAKPTLSHILSLLLPITCTLPLSLNTINETPFCPESKNEDLHSGWLQVPQGTLYLLTESGITEGSVRNKGLENLRAVQDMMNGQTLDYVFPFSRFTFPTDTSNNVTLKPRSGMEFDLFKPLDKIRLPDEEVLEQWRDFIGGSKIGTVTIEDGTAQYIQDDFVNERKIAQGKGSAMTSDDLIHRMITARLLALSYHETLVTRDVWEKTKALETEKKSRI
ncbi:hypothetical protein AGABI1DRAFT_104708 [Agaricus bisporus var. burnettii JB137-S8]|uniref:Uncharacterized protein n=1 Tax=Agaricus bisporus var. burnettii (strain JB137-S8 / ATCC MYA-4627 / FGSC 10392) TaxID=597362 RepID=K5W7P2_AGABU|nr:uncharacterized protein AGABI1DRAFT_104708 [Agaricus bisporus var. burnettii JB137-S8]EKM82874.1 hypothetical protein AGABI1DRAFT_104708 [Agaricus bisporus var. burnettii JB137-S8]